MKPIIITILFLSINLLSYARELGYDLDYTYRGMKGVATYEYVSDINNNDVLDGSFFFKTITATGEITVSGAYNNGERNGIWTLQETVAGIEYRTEEENYDNGLLCGDANSSLMPIKSGDICVITQKHYSNWVLDSVYSEIHINPITKYLNKKIDVSFADDNSQATIYKYEQHSANTDTVISGKFTHSLAAGTWEKYIRNNDAATKETEKYLNGVKYYSIVKDTKTGRIISRYPSVAKDTIGIKKMIESTITAIKDSIITTSPMQKTSYIVENRTIGYVIDINKKAEIETSDTLNTDFLNNKDVLEYLNNIMIYPPKALNEGIEGTVDVKFIISPQGDICKVGIAKSVTPELDAEAVRILRNLPDLTNLTGVKFTSPVTISLPITFNIADYKSRKP